MGVLRRLMHLAAKRLHPQKKTLPQAESSIPVPGEKITPVDSKQNGAVRQNVAAGQTVDSEEDNFFSFEVDWSVFSMEHLKMTIQEFLFSLAGLPLPVDPSNRNYATVCNGFWRSRLELDELYKPQLLEAAENSGFLVRGVIYDMAAIASPHARVPKEDFRKKDWSSLIYENENASKLGKVEDVSAEQVLEKLGLKNESGLKERVGSSKSALDLRKQQLKEKQKLETIIATGDSIRAKYADRLTQKRVLAETRREQAKMGMFVTTSPGNDSCRSSCSVVPGSPSLVRYLEERGVAQALLTRGPDTELKSLLDQLGNFQFREVRRLRDSSSPGEVLSEGMLRSICTKWGLPPKQVLVVVGGNGESEELLKTVADKGYFVCRVEDDSSEQQRLTTNNAGNRGQAFQFDSDPGISTWSSQLAEGTLHIADEKQKLRRNHVHFRVVDMTELKWVIEDLNGVSYRSSTRLFE